MDGGIDGARKRDGKRKRKKQYVQYASPRGRSEHRGIGTTLQPQDMGVINHTLDCIWALRSRSDGTDTGKKGRREDFFGFCDSGVIMSC